MENNRFIYFIIIIFKDFLKKIKTFINLIIETFNFLK